MGEVTEIKCGHRPKYLPSILLQTKPCFRVKRIFFILDNNLVFSYDCVCAFYREERSVDILL